MRKKEHFQREVDTRRSRQLSERDVLPVLWPVCACVVCHLGREDCTFVVSTKFTPTDERKRGYNHGGEGAKFRCVRMLALFHTYYPPVPFSSVSFPITSIFEQTVWFEINTIFSTCRCRRCVGAKSRGQQRRGCFSAPEPDEHAKHSAKPPGS